MNRADFVPDELKDEAYEDYPLPIGFGATVSQPTTVAFMLEKLGVRKGDNVLDIGSGSGWTTALLAHLVGPRGKVIGLEIVHELVALGRKNIERAYSDVLENIRIKKPIINQAKRGSAGLPEEAPFDRILVSAAAEKIPKELQRQLADGGILVVPVGEKGASQTIFRLQKKRDGQFETEEYPGFAFVPLQ
ncbi:MAG: protein-L-isoaspartate O-methyltransferase [Candidatus Taylorbacteria bacterium]|nr:protein-L-isoaspartate O-methyltransferase [Candidatus Taylorbacteria bacterium]